MDLLDLNKLEEVSRRRGLRFVALFGSSAREMRRPGSDLDLAAMPDDLDLTSAGRLPLAQDLIDTVHRSDLDVVWLPTAGWLLQREVAREGGSFSSFDPARSRSSSGWRTGWRWTATAGGGSRRSS